MSIKHLSALAVLSVASIFFTLAAEASPRFTVHNEIGKDVTVYIFSGDDGVCSFDEKQRDIPAGKSRSYGCTGHGTGRCKIQLYAKGEQICKSDRNACGHTATRIQNDGSVTISQHDHKISCAFEN